MRKGKPSLGGSGRILAVGVAVPTPPPIGRSEDMTPRAENELLTQIGPGTPMGALLRQYWVPACLSSELIADGDPVRLALLGEKLVAFRDSSGKIGILDHRCPHRSAHLFFGSNERGALRSVY